MKSIKSYSILVVAAVLLAVVVSFIMPTNAVGQESRQNAAGRRPQTPQNNAAAGIVPQQPQTPVLRIGGQESADVYLQSLDIQVEVTGSVASTRYTMVFKNKTNRILEGELTIPLPDGVTVTHHALDINGRMREAVPVEKARATQVFEEIQQRAQVIDPSILERVEGNNFRTRIYPIPANGVRTIAIGYEEELTLESGQLFYRLPMAYADSLEKFSVKATVWQRDVAPIVPSSGDQIRFDRAGENYVAEFTRANHRPSRALIFALPAPPDIPQVVMQSAQGSFYFMASVAPNVTARRKQWGEDLAIIWDVSLSGSQRDLQCEMEALEIIFAEKRNANVRLYFLNNQLKEAPSGSGNGSYRVSNGNWNTLKRALEAAVFDGGTDFSQIKLSDIRGNEILFFSDGISTLSDADFLSGADTGVGANNNRPIHTIVSSSKADYSVMRLISGKTRGKFVNINALSAAQLRTELLNETLQFLGIEHGNAVSEVYPSIAGPVQGNFSVAGITNNANAELTLLFGFGNRVEKRVQVRLNARNASRQGNVHRIWAQKKIAELDLNYEANRAELTELGTQFGIVTRNTSLIVLEDVDDYVRYNIEPPTSEPELLAAYRNRQKGRNDQRAADERDMLESAVAAARHIERWWGTTFSQPRPPRYPTPDNDQSSRKSVESGGDLRHSKKGGRLNSPGRRRPSSPPSSSDFESLEVIGHLDNPSPVSINEQRSSETDAPARGRVVADGETLGRGGFATDIDAIISESGGLQAGGDGGTGRKGMAGIGYWSGVGSGFGGSGGGVDDLLPVISSGGGDINLTKKMRSSSDERERGSMSPGAAAGGGDPRARVTKRGVLGEAMADGQRQRTEERESQPVIRRAAIRQDSEYMKQLTGNVAQDYQTYLKLRNDYSNSPDFYFDMANWFFGKDKEIALRILTSIADLELENASLYRLLGYRLKEYGEYALQKFVCKKVIEWRPMEPQAYRDYALALADFGEAQAALDSLYSLLTRAYSANIGRRSAGIEEVVITEMNRLIAKNPRLNTSRIDNRLKINIPIDVRVVINWNMNNVDIDLHVVDPTGEECYYSNDLTRIGGRISHDNTSGYGPEQFVLRNAMRGKYRVLVNYFGAREFSAAGPSTVMAEIYMKYADKSEQRQVVCLQLSSAQTQARRRGDMVEVAEFEF